MKILHEERGTFYLLNGVSNVDFFCVYPLTWLALQSAAVWELCVVLTDAYGRAKVHF